MMFWYYALAGRLTPAEAWDAALAWDGDQVTTVEVDGRVCVDAAVNLTGTAEALPGIIALYQRWGALAPVESSTVVNVTGQQLMITACDPGVAIDTAPNDVVSPLGESIQEYEMVGRTGAADETERACVVNAVRGFGIVDAMAGGADMTQVVTDLAAACVS
jgi:hypothetical protein